MYANKTRRNSYGWSQSQIDQLANTSKTPSNYSSASSVVRRLRWVDWQDNRFDRDPLNKQLVRDPTSERHTQMPRRRTLGEYLYFEPSISSTMSSDSDVARRVADAGKDYVSSTNRSVASNLTQDSDGFYMDRNARPSGFLAQTMTPAHRQELMDLMSERNDHEGIRRLEQAIATNDIRSSDRLDDYLLNNYFGETIRLPRKNGPIVSNNTSSSSERRYEEEGFRRENAQTNEKRRSNPFKSFFKRKNKRNC